MKDIVALCGILKLFEIPLMCLEKLLLNKLVSFWDRHLECLIIQGERLEITLRDVYLFTSLPLLGIIDDISRKLPRGVLMDDLCARNCYATAYVYAPYILVCDIESLETHVVETMVLQILGSKGPHKISSS